MFAHPDKNLKKNYFPNFRNFEKYIYDFKKIKLYNFLTYTPGVYDGFSVRVFGIICFQKLETFIFLQFAPPKWQRFKDVLPVDL